MNRRKLIDVDIVMRDVKQLLKATHTVKQKVFSYNYKGLDLKHSCILAGSLSIKESMKKKNVEWASEEHGIEMLDTILMKIFQLGYEQRQIELDIEIRKYGDPIKTENKEKVDALMKIVEINKSGYAGILPNGNIVDRRDHPEATPVQKNSLFGVPKPILQMATACGMFEQNPLITSALMCKNCGKAKLFHLTPQPK